MEDTQLEFSTYDSCFVNNMEIPVSNPAQLAFRITNILEMYILY